MEWSVRHALFETQVALDQILRNFPSTFIGLILRGIVFPLGRRYRTPNDSLTQACARILLSESRHEIGLLKVCISVDDPEDVTGSIEFAMKAVLAADAAERKLKAAKKVNRMMWITRNWLRALGSENVITEEEINNLMIAADAVKRSLMWTTFLTCQARRIDYLATYSLKTVHKKADRLC